MNNSSYNYISLEEEINKANIKIIEKIVLNGIEPGYFFSPGLYFCGAGRMMEQPEAWQNWGREPKHPRD